MNYWKPQHEVFIRCMLKHEDPTRAYQIAYPKAKPTSARVGGCRLYGYPHIRQRLEPILNQRRVENHKRALAEGAARARRENKRRLEMRRVLYKVVMKQLRRQRVFIINRRTVTVEEDPSTNTILNAMVLDIRLEAGYNNWPVIERRFARIMASLLPREKREQPSVSKLVNSNEKTLFNEQTVMNLQASPLRSAISGVCAEATLQQNNKQLPSSDEEPCRNIIRSCRRGWLKS